MQFTVLIEFLVPGLATTLLLLIIVLDGVVPQLPQNLHVGETASALLLLAVSYPVGILVNFPLFALQRRLVSRNARQNVFEKYGKRDIDLVEVVSKQFHITPVSLPSDRREKLQMLFHLMSGFVFSKNIGRQYSNHIYHEGLQRLARGILPPLILASYVVWKYRTPSWLLLVMFFIALAVSACFLVRHSVNVEYDQIARYFLVMVNTERHAGIQTSEMADRAQSP